MRTLEGREEEKGRWKVSDEKRRRWRERERGMT